MPRLQVLSLAILAAPGNPGSDTWGAESAGLDLAQFPDLSSPSAATSRLRVLALAAYRPCGGSDHVTSLRLATACILAGVVPGPTGDPGLGHYAMGSEALGHLLSLACPYAWSVLSNAGASKLDKLAEVSAVPRLPSLW